MCAVAVSAAPMASLAHPESATHCARGIGWQTFDDALRRCVAVEREIEGERGRTEAERIVNRFVCAIAADVGKTRSDEAIVERRRGEAGRCSRRRDDRGLVHTQRTRFPSHVVDRAYAANAANALPRGRDLKGTNEHEQACR
jgi:hypothetical protein